MFKLLHLLQSLLARHQPRHEYDEEYLAEAVDIYDLERRMRAIDERGRNGLSAIAIGLYPR
jgi:hypothetical protein